MTTKAYFCCNPTDDTLIFYDSAEEAEEAARHAIEHATDGDWHPEVLGICWGLVIESAEVAGLHEHASGSACVEAGSGGLCSAGVPVHVDFGGEVTLRRHEVPDDDPATTRIAALEAELARLRAELADDPTADTAEEPAEAPAPTPVVESPWRPPGWYRDTDGTVGRLLAVDRFAGTQTLRWGDAPAVLTPGPRPERRLSASEVQRLEPVPAPGDDPAGSAR